MIDFSKMRGKEILRVLRRKLYGIVCEHVKNFDDENVLGRVERFLEGVSWVSGLRYAVRGDGEVYVYLKGPDHGSTRLYEIEVLDVCIETKILRNSVNRHYYKQDKKNLKEVRF